MIIQVTSGFAKPGLPSNQTFTISGSLLYLLHSDTLYDYYAHDVRVQNERTFVLEEHELPDGHTEYRGEVRGDQTKIDASGFSRILETTDDDVEKLATAVDELKVPTDSTLEYNSDNELKVNVQDVIEHLQERIRYYTNANTYGDAGASVGQVYETSQYRKIITKVEVLFDPLVGADAFLVRLVELNSDNSIKTKLFTSNTRSAPFGAGGAVRAFTFHNAAGDPGVTIGKGIRLGILLSRTGDNSDSSVEAIHGSEAANSPGETYDDASTDFHLVNDVVYNHIDPAVNASTHSHGTDIRGNIKIFYTNIIDHGNLVGDGNVQASDINSGTATDGDVLTADGSEGATWETPEVEGLTPATETIIYTDDDVTFVAATPQNFTLDVGLDTFDTPGIVQFRMIQDFTDGSSDNDLRGLRIEAEFSLGLIQDLPAIVDADFSNTSYENVVLARTLRIGNIDSHLTICKHQRSLSVEKAILNFVSQPLILY